MKMKNDKMVSEFFNKVSVRLQESNKKNREQETKAIAQGLQRVWNKNLQKFVWIKK
jgi:hypothetical protein